MSFSNGRLKVLVAAKDREIRDRLCAAISEGGRYRVTATATDGQEAVQLAVMLHPNVALLQADLPIIDGAAAAVMIGFAAPDVRSVLLGDGQPTVDVLNQAMLSGLRAYLPMPYHNADVLSTIQSLDEIDSRRDTNEFITATDPALLPRVIVVTGAKGGIGKTTISTCLAMHLGQKFPGKVVLFDMYTQFGDVASVLGIEAPRPLCELVTAGDTIDADMLESCLVDHYTGIKVLIAATSVQPLDAISIAQAESIIYALKRTYTYIVIDLPPVLHPTTLYMLSNCHRLLMVTTLFDMPTVSGCAKLYKEIATEYLPEDKISVIANRVSKKDGLVLKDVETLLGRKVAAQVPNDPRLVSAVNQGISFVKAYSGSPLVRAIESIARDFVSKDIVSH